MRKNKNNGYVNVAGENIRVFTNEKVLVAQINGVGEFGIPEAINGVVKMHEGDKPNFRFAVRLATLKAVRESLRLMVEGFEKVIASRIAFYNSLANEINSMEPTANIPRMIGIRCKFGPFPPKKVKIKKER